LVYHAEWEYQFGQHNPNVMNIEDSHGQSSLEEVCGRCQFHGIYKNNWLKMLTWANTLFRGFGKPTYWKLKPMSDL
jgi:hypothetical protein